MFRIVPNVSQTQQTMDGKRHCIVVAASNPYPLPTPIYQPKFQILENDNIEAQAESCLSDAEAVAGIFPQVASITTTNNFSPPQIQRNFKHALAKYYHGTGLHFFVSYLSKAACKS